jgi:hypothetical protein
MSSYEPRIKVLKMVWTSRFLMSLFAVLSVIFDRNCLQYQGLHCVYFYSPNKKEGLHCICDCDLKLLRVSHWLVIYSLSSVYKLIVWGGFRPKIQLLRCIRASHRSIIWPTSLLFHLHLSMLQMSILGLEGMCYDPCQSTPFDPRFKCPIQRVTWYVKSLL